MEKRYQVFVSSTYEDLKEERLEVMKALLELECIPCGMEYFPAANEDQWTFIKKLIDNCDYYVVIIGGCYGSVDEVGLSYTRKEYEYAMSQGIPTIGFIIKDRGMLSAGKRDVDGGKMQKLDEFIYLVRTKLCKDWSTTHELGAVVSRSLTQLIKSTPRVGWVRSDKVSSEELLTDINKLRKENEMLKDQITQMVTSDNIEITDIASLDEKFTVSGTYYNDYSHGANRWTLACTWEHIFSLIAPYLLRFPNEEYIETVLKSSLFEETKYSSTGYYWDNQIFQTIKVQLIALGLINVKYSATTKGDMALFWSLTGKGEALLFKSRTIKKKK